MQVIIITYDVAGAGTVAFQGTLSQGINPEGTIAGNYLDASYVSHGFVRASDGTIITFDAPAQALAPVRGRSLLSRIRRARSPDGTLMGAMYFTASSWEASKPSERVSIIGHSASFLRSKGYI
jgi:hypothetical protein